MSMVIECQTYFRTKEVCRKLGMSRNTLFRWLKNGAIGKIEHRDWRGWRLCKADQVKIIKRKTDHITARRLNKD